jgi:hypothetical protein
MDMDWTTGSHAEDDKIDGAVNFCSCRLSAGQGTLHGPVQASVVIDLLGISVITAFKQDIRARSIITSSVWLQVKL